MRFFKYSSDNLFFFMYKKHGILKEYRADLLSTTILFLPDSESIPEYDSDPESRNTE